MSTTGHVQRTHLASGWAIMGELTLDQAYERMEQDIQQQIAEKKQGG